MMREVIVIHTSVLGPAHEWTLLAVSDMARWQTEA